MARPAKEKDPVAVQIGQRIKQAREMGGFITQAALNAILAQRYGWSAGRLGNYEAGYSIPHPGDIQILAAETGSSACWIMFGAGPIRSRERDIQAIRHQNLMHVVALLRAEEGAYAKFLEAARSDDQTLRAFLDNPFRRIGDRLARQFEKALGKRHGWFDEQHIESDPVCSRFPDELRELMTIYSEQDERGRQLLLRLARATKAG